MNNPNPLAVRKEGDTLGELSVPIEAYWGKSTQRTLNFFQISDRTFPKEFVISLALVKKAAAKANKRLGVVDAKIADAIIQACNEIIEENKLLDQFPVDVFQTGSGTAINMNMNEVLANRANELLGGKKGEYKPVHPNDHVNKCQSSNDVIPTAMHIALLSSTKKLLVPALEQFAKGLEAKIKEFEGITKVGRTHLQDAVPIPLAMEFEVYRKQIQLHIKRLEIAYNELIFLPLGGTALGTGINAHPDFAYTAIAELTKLTKFNFQPLDVKAESIASHNRIVFLADVLKDLALTLIKIANDIRLMSSGPRAGLSELIIPANELGSSIMPGKINPTQAEMLVQVSLKVLGMQNIVTQSEALLSNLDLNVAKPLIIVEILEAIKILSNGILSFLKHCLMGLKANTKKIEADLEKDLMKVTKLAPIIGYEHASKIALKAHKENKNLPEVIYELYPKDEAKRLIELLIEE